VNKTPKRSKVTYSEKAIKIHNWQTQNFSPFNCFSCTIDINVSIFYFYSLLWTTELKYQISWKLFCGPKAVNQNKWCFIVLNYTWSQLFYSIHTIKKIGRLDFSLREHSLKLNIKKIKWADFD
jgi:hypothetical protein